MMINKLDKFTKERNEAMLSLDKDKIIAYCKKYQIDLPRNEEVFWIGVHKSITAITSAPREKRLASVKYLMERDFEHYLSDITADEESRIRNDISQSTLKEE